MVSPSRLLTADVRSLGLFRWGPTGRPLPSWWPTGGRWLVPWQVRFHFLRSSVTMTWMWSRPSQTCETRNAGDPSQLCRGGHSSSTPALSGELDGRLRDLVRAPVLVLHIVIEPLP